MYAINPTELSKKLIKVKTYEARQKEIKISFIWVPVHGGIEGNETADHEASKAAFSMDTPILKLIPHVDTKVLG